MDDGRVRVCCGAEERLLLTAAFAQTIEVDDDAVD
jgi:hypothetical protein